MHPAIAVRTYSIPNLQRAVAFSPFFQRTTKSTGYKVLNSRISAQYPRFQPRRTMASSAATAKGGEWLVIMPDKPGTLSKRVEVRNSHLSNLGPILDSGFLKTGGSLLEHHPKEGETPPMKGSFLVVQAETAEEVKDILSKDVYATSGVWDIDNMQITPVKSAVRKPL